MTKREQWWQIIKFTLLSASAGVIQIIVDVLFNEVVKTSIPVSYAIALTASVVYNFTLNRRFTFKAANNVPVAMLKVLGYYAVFGPLSYWLTEVLANQHPEWKYFLLAGCMIVNFVTEFLFDKFVVFRGSENTNDLAKRDEQKAADKQESDNTLLDDGEDVEAEEFVSEN